MSTGFSQNRLKIQIKTSCGKENNDMELNFELDRQSLIPLYAQLAQALKTAVLNGEIAYGEKLPSENELVARYKLSRMTVRSALSSLATEHYIEKQQGRGAFACYRRPAASGNIDVLLDISYTYFASNYIQSISDVLSQHNYRFIIHDTRDSQAEICSIVSEVLANGSAGILLQPSHKLEPLLPELREAFARVADRGIPYVMLDHVYEDLPGCRMVFDDYGGGKAAAEYLISLGHRRCAMVCCSSICENALRRSGFESVFSARRLPPPLLLENDDTLPDALLELTRQARVSAVFNFNDEVALKTMRILHGANIRIPEEISVLGYDDTVIAAATNPQLTTVIHPKDLLGRMAAEKLISMIERYPFKPSPNLLEPRLHIRASCAPYQEHR
jgi:GntR family transcriptional regulator of arabinose operon